MSTDMLHQNLTCPRFRLSLCLLVSADYSAVTTVSPFWSRVAGRRDGETNLRTTTQKSGIGYLSFVGCTGIVDRLHCIFSSEGEKEKSQSPRHHSWRVTAHGHGCDCGFCLMGVQYNVWPLKSIYSSLWYQHLKLQSRRDEYSLLSFVKILNKDWPLKRCVQL